jgi:nucleotide-binding universal stress UspA family protein
VVPAGDDIAEEPTDGPHEVLRLAIDHDHGRTARSVAEALGTCAGERGAALIVVRSRGRSAVREILLGSVAMATLHRTYRPVMVVPRSGHARS